MEGNLYNENNLDLGYLGIKHLATKDIIGRMHMKITCMFYYIHLISFCWEDIASHQVSFYISKYICTRLNLNSRQHNINICVYMWELQNSQVIVAWGVWPWF